MATKTNITSARPETRSGYWRRVLLPLFWWLFLVLVLLAIHQHQVWIERTRLYCSVTMYGTNVLDDAVGTLDGHEIQSGDKISLGRHEFKITEPKATSFSTNFFAWYGLHDFGKIDLKRSMGTLNVSAAPPANIIIIRGPEFFLQLQGSSGTNLTVPTDHYTVEAQYPHWSQTQNEIVSGDMQATCAFTPQFGVLHLTCNHDEATYLLESSHGQRLAGGDLPATVDELPIGNYQLTVHYHQQQIQKSVRVESGTTNDVPVEFVLGGVRLESVPDGANVNTSDGKYLGQTPLDLSDITPQTARFNLSLSGYEPVTIGVDIIADQTTTVTTNLLNVRYGEALRQARQYRDAGNYNGALQAVKDALAVKPGDAETAALQAEITEQANEARKKSEAEQQKLNEQHQQAEAARQQANAAANAEKQRLERLNRPHDYFVNLMRETPNSADFVEQNLKVSGNASDLRIKIANALSKSLLLKFAIEQNQEPFAGGFFIRGKLSMVEGYRTCYIVGGQTADGEVTILFKVMEYSWPQDLMLGALLSRPSDDKAIPLDQSNVSASLKQSRRDLGIKIVTERIQQAMR